MRHHFTYPALALLALTCGCAIYHPQPLDSAAVDAALQPPKLDAVRIAAAKIEHPLVKPIVIDGRDGFSPDEIAVMVVIVSPQLRALRDQRGVADAQVLQAGILPNPQLGYTLDQLHGDAAQALVSGPLTNGNSLGLSWDVTSLLVHHDAVAAAKASGAALDLSIAWQEWQAAQDARLRAFRLLSLDQRLPLAREIEDDLADNVKLTQQALSLGQKTSMDLTAATETWTQAQNSRFALEQQITAERAALNLALGQPADALLRLKPATVFPALPTDLAAGLLQGLEKRRLDLVALTLGYKSEEATLRAAVIAQFPKIGLSIAKASDTSDVHTISYGVTVDLPLFDRNQGQVAIGRATRQQLFDEYIARVAEARAEVVQILADLAVTRAQLQTVDDSLPQIEQLTDSLTREFQARNADVLAYRDARGTLAARRMEQMELQQSLLELGVALEIATGRPLLNRDPSH
ncbi:MAG TPA: TolC family protein [Opitutaceae bacterium]|jgi:outer membrane protein TolC|nr:TolC family protein [Opitutaceae bacterium]